jgi:hypothetical protein
MKRTIPMWRAKVAVYGAEEGSMEWSGAERERWYCPSYGGPLLRGAQGCRVCKGPVADDPDGSLQAELSVRQMHQRLDK